MMTSHDRDAAALLLAAADLIEPPGKWVQGGLAGDQYGRPLRGAVTGADFCGHCWCVFGAIDKAWWNARCIDHQNISLSAADAAKMRLQEHLGMNPMAWNDQAGRVQAEAVAALREAAAKP
jgi:hypothetical protein